MAEKVPTIKAGSKKINFEMDNKLHLIAALGAENYWKKC